MCGTAPGDCVQPSVWCYSSVVGISCAGACFNRPRLRLPTRVHLRRFRVPTKDARHQTCRSGDDALRVTVSSVRDKRRRRRRRIGRIASMPRGADGDTRDGATDAGRGRVGRNAVRSARAGRAYSAASWYFLILAILAWCPRGARPPTRDRRPPASSVHGRSFELPQAGHTAPQCADRASARIVYRFAADPPRAAAVAEDRGSGIFRLGVGHCARLLPRVHAFPEITELTSDVDVTTRVDGRRRSIRTACPRTTGPGYTGYEPGPRAG